ncbi:MAG: DUF4350 domain-containing protein [Timaviella obliquedivisa GSE-PSE-MK23-08B]|jgi:hypothetical protein|nr:DUF4350 domain-containing protein [Timaviella obliquedivisa GSE-PSE-MK23-08B]
MKKALWGRQLWLWAILLIPLLVILVFASLRAPAMQGSTYSRAPSGYGAWYASLQQQGITVKRWQQPLEELMKSPSLPRGEEVVQYGSKHDSSGRVLSRLGEAPVTLVRIANGRERISLPIAHQNWVKQGNVVILLGVRSPVTNAPFSSNLPSSVGAVKVETRRRHTQKTAEQNIILKDAAGAVVWEQVLGQGKIISVATPHLAANAYQNEPGNFKFLTKLVIASGNPIWIDEYFHGFRDQKAIAQDRSGSLARYLAQTSLPVLAMQALIILLVLIWEKNQRFGLPIKLLPPKLDNSEAYIQALAGVLQKANCSEFVWETVGKAERAYVQRSLGLGIDPVEPQVMVDAWVQQTGRPAAELEDVLSQPHQKRPNRQELLTWLGKVQTLHRQLGNP